jgi:DNA-binding CsgD family transcriptional regulator
MAELAVLRGRIEFARGSAVTAHDLLRSAAEAIADRDAQAAAVVAVEAARAAWTANDPVRLAEVTKLLAGLALPADDPLVALGSITIAIADFFAGRTVEGVVGMRRGFDAWRQRAAIGGTEHDAGLVEASLALVGYTRVTADDATGLALGASVVAECRRRGWVAWLPWSLVNLSLTEVVAGRHAAALANATEGLQLARDLGQPASICRCASVLAWLAAVSGDEDRCRELARETIELAEMHRLPTIAVSATWALGLLELSLGRPERAFDRLADPTAGPLAVPHFVCLFLPDLLEAAVRAGRTVDDPGEPDGPDGPGEPDGLGNLGKLGDHVAWYEEWSAATNQPVAEANLHRCRALLHNEAAEHHYTEALRLFEQAGPDQRPFDRARTQLLHGEWLRRARRRAEARPLLAAALETFERLGARPWAERAATELRATGQALRRPDAARVPLTPQEMQVVRLVAEGGSNQEVAAKLFLSPRTVGYHLYKAFPKLGVRSRAELAHLDLDALDGSTTH